MVRKIFRILLLVVFLLLLVRYNRMYQVCAFHPFMEEKSADLRVMTWNIHNTGEGIQERIPAIAQLIIAEDADVVLLNEFCMRMDASLDTLLRNHYPYQNAKWANVLAGDILYSKYPIQASKRMANDSVCPLAYEFQLKVNDRLLRVVGCHLISTNNFDREHRYTLKNWHDLSTLPAYYELYQKGQAHRTLEARLISELLDNEPMCSIVMGDMNDMCGTPPLNVFQNSELQDAWWNGGTGLGFTFHEGWMRFRLDHILFNDSLELSSVKVIKSELSDHYPVLAEFDFR